MPPGGRYALGDEAGRLQIGTKSETPARGRVESAPGARVFFAESAVLSGLPFIAQGQPFVAQGEQVQPAPVQRTSAQEAGSRMALKNLATQHGILEGLGRSQTHNGPRLDLDGLAGLWIAAHARLAMSLDRASQVGDHEFPGAASAFLHSQLEEFVKKLRRAFFGGAALVGDITHNLGLAQGLCHIRLKSPSLARLVPGRHGRFHRGQGRARATL
jgi:hypothetical protein